MQESSKKLFQWFADNQSKTNENVKQETSQSKTVPMKSCCVLALVENLILIVMLTIYAIKSNKKLRALARVTPCMALEKKEYCHELIF